jgi:hypothetical protein
MNLGTHMPGGERRKPIDIEYRRTKVKGSCDFDLCPTNLNIDRLPPFTKFHLDPTFCSQDIVRKRKKYQFVFLFLEVVTLTIVLQSSISIGFLLSPPGMWEDDVDNLISLLTLTNKNLYCQSSGFERLAFH